MRTVLVDWLQVVEVWVGANFLFGHDRAGTFTVLRSLGARYGFRAEKIDPVRYKDFVVSSTRIRRLRREGRVDEAGALLGHHYFIDGTVTQGRRPGPRARVSRPRISRPQRAAAAERVYATTVTIDGIVHPSVTNVGMRPTFGDVGSDHDRDAPARFDRDLYGAPLRLSFVQRLRDERAFPDVDALRAQIDADCRARPPPVRPDFAVESSVHVRSESGTAGPWQLAAHRGAALVRACDRATRACGRDRSPALIAGSPARVGACDCAQVARSRRLTASGAPSVGTAVERCRARSSSAQMRTASSRSSAVRHADRPRPLTAPA